MAEDVQKEVVVAAPVSEVWRLWTTSEGITEFFAPSAHVELREGGAFEMYFMPEPDEVGRGSEGCTIVSYEPERRLTFTWNASPANPELRRRREYTRVDLTLEPRGDETCVRLHHYELGSGPDWDAYHAYFDEAWGRVLESLRAHCAGPPAFTELMPHGQIEPIFSDVFFVTGTSRPTFAGQTWQFSRNMTIIRDGSALTLINTVRLDDAGLAALDALGRVENVVKIGAFHGIDDAFYGHRYHARQWALPGHEHEGGQATDGELVVGGPMPCLGCELFVFETSTQPEGLLLLEREGGVLIACDSLQNWAEHDRFFSEDSAQKMAAFGFIQPANVGPGWRQSCNPQASDFARLKALSFRHLLPAHGTPLRDTAHAALSARFAELYGV